MPLALVVKALFPARRTRSRRAPAATPRERRFSTFGRAVLAASVLIGAAACASMEKECQRVCEWESECVVGAVGVEDCASQCVNDNDSRSDDCRNAFDDFANCTAKNQSCPGVDTQCGAQATRVIEKCDCTNPTGPMKALCGD